MEVSLYPGGASDTDGNLTFYHNNDEGNMEWGFGAKGVCTFIASYIHPITILNHSTPYCRSE